MTISHAQAAKVMGMKEREITDVQPRAGGGYVVTTFDSQRTELLPTGKAVPVVQPKPGAEPAAAAETSSSTEAPAKPAKTTPAKRTRKPKPGTEQPNAGDDVPSDVYPAEGAESDRLAWVGDRPDRAAAALEIERDRDEPDEPLVAKLEAIAGDGAAAG